MGIKRKFIFRRKDVDWDEISEINTQTGDMYNYCQDRVDGTVFREQVDNIFKLGWENIPEFIKNRRSKDWGYREVV